MGIPANNDNMIVMLRHHMDGLPHFDFPEGFYARGMRPQDVDTWTGIWREVEPAGTIQDDIFNREFGSDWDEIGKRCFIVFSTDGSPAGTISSWFNNSFKGGSWGRIHWVAAVKACQGKGLAKPMMSMAMEKMASMHDRCYLVTHAHRIPAVSLYLKFGFLPDTSSEKSRILWDSVAKEIRIPELKEIIMRELH